LGEFFDVWGETFNENCILDSCVDDEHSIKVIVDGKERFEGREIVFRDRQRIEIVYE